MKAWGDRLRRPGGVGAGARTRPLDGRVARPGPPAGDDLHRRGPEADEDREYLRGESGGRPHLSG